MISYTKQNMHHVRILIKKPDNDGSRQYKAVIKHILVLFYLSTDDDIPNFDKIDTSGDLIVFNFRAIPSKAH